MSAVAGKVPGAVVDGIYELEERAAFLAVACAALALKPDATVALLHDKALRGLEWWTRDIEEGLNVLHGLVNEDK